MFITASTAALAAALTIAPTAPADTQSVADIQVQSVAATSTAPAWFAGRVGQWFHAEIEPPSGADSTNYSVSTGLLPKGLDFDPETGIISGVPEEEIVQVTGFDAVDHFGFIDDIRQVYVVFNIAGSAEDEPGSGPDAASTAAPNSFVGFVGQPFAEHVVWWSMPEGTTYALAADAVLPAGLTLSTDGLITGVPTQDGVRVTGIEATFPDGGVQRIWILFAIIDPADALPGPGDPELPIEG